MLLVNPSKRVFVCVILFVFKGHQCNVLSLTKHKAIARVRCTAMSLSARVVPLRRDVYGLGFSPFLSGGPIVD